MPLYKFLEFIDVGSECKIKSVFGNTGIFYRGVMFAQIDETRLFLRGGNGLDDRLRSLGCTNYVHVKKQSCSEMNYFDVSDLLLSKHYQIRDLITCSYRSALKERQDRQLTTMKKLRELPNMNMTLERMLKRVSILDTKMLNEVGPAYAFVAIKKHYGRSSDVRLLWKFYGALNGIYWELVEENEKQRLMEQCQKIEWEAEVAVL
jgi:DNA transformation protein and related proteins